MSEDRYVVWCFRSSIIPNHEVKKCLKLMVREKRFWLCNKRLQHREWNILLKVLKETDDLESLNLSYANLQQQKSFKALGTLLRSPYLDLVWLNLSGIDFHDKGSCLLSSISAPRYLEDLHLSGCNLHDNDLEKILSSEPNKKLKNLDMSSNKIEGKKDILQKLLQSFEIMKELDLSWNNINWSNTQQLACSLAVNESLFTLNLSFNGLSDEGALEMTFVLQKNTTLKVLDLSENRISNRGAEFLANGLSINTSLKSLNLSGNMMTAQGMQCILVGAITSRSLQELHMKQISPDVLCKKAIDHLKANDVILSFGVPTLAKSTSTSVREVFVREQIFSEIRNFLTKERLRVLDLFKMWDKKKNGEISLDNLMMGLESVNIPVTKAILEKIFGILDKDNNTSLTYSEFARISKI